MSGLEKALAVAAIVGVTAMATWWCVGGYELGIGIGVLGVGVSFAGLMVAIAIFLNQDRTTAANHDELLSAVGERKAQAAARHEGDETGEDPYAEESALLEAYGAPVGDGVRRFAQKDIPLKLVRDLVVGWERLGESGSWTIDEVRSARRRSGKGNHAWWLVTRDPGTQVERVFKVARGGQGLREVTVTEIGD